MACVNERGEYVEHSTHSLKRGDVSTVVWRRYLHDLHRADILLGSELEQLEHLAREKPAWFRPASAP